jgi:hypothetical protein
LELKKAIYGLRQAPPVCVSYNAGFFHLAIGPLCLLAGGSTKPRKHVDDLVIISKRPEKFKEEMAAEFSIKYLGEAVFLLGMNIERSGHGISINQTQYIERKLLHLALTHCTLRHVLSIQKST